MVCIGLKVDSAKVWLGNRIIVDDYWGNAMIDNAGGPLC